MFSTTGCSLLDTFQNTSASAKLLYIAHEINMYSIDFIFLHPLVFNDCREMGYAQNYIQKQRKWYSHLCTRRKPYHNETKNE